MNLSKPSFGWKKILLSFIAAAALLTGGYLYDNRLNLNIDKAVENAIESVKKIGYEGNIINNLKAFFGISFALEPGYSIATTTFYVATTGSDTSSCQSSSAPCLTLQHTLNAACPSIRSGAAEVVMATGTYRENIIVPSCINNAQSETNALAEIGSNVLYIRASGADGSAIIESPNNSITTAVDVPNGFFGTLLMDGISVSSSKSGSRGVEVNSGYVVLRDVNMSNVGTPLVHNGSANIRIDSKTAATSTYVKNSGTAVVVSMGTTANGSLVIATPLIVSSTNSTSNVFSCSRSGLIQITGSGALHIYGTSGTAQVGLSLAGDCKLNSTGTRDIVFRGFTVATSTFTPFPPAAAVRVTDGAELSVVGARWVFDNVVNPWAFFGQARYIDTSTGTYSYINGSNMRAYVSTAAALIASSTSVTGAQSFFGGVELIPFNLHPENDRFGGDFRWSSQALGIGGQEPPPTNTLSFLSYTAHFNDQNVPLYVAQDNIEVARMYVKAFDGNGAGNTDTYFVSKNGVTTTASCSITNGTTCQFTTSTLNSIKFVTGDDVGCAIQTGASTTMDAVTCSIEIRKR